MWHILFPPFDFFHVVIAPWSGLELGNTLQICLMGAFVTTACGLVGQFLILRRMALVGDAISHSLLPGIVIAFLLTSSRATLPMFIGAVAAGILTTVLIEYIHKRSRVKTDAAIGIVFTTLFAIGVILINLFSDHVDLDADCVLYGEIAYVGLERPVSLAGIPLGTEPLARMGAVLLVVAGLIAFFYKELVVTSFDPGLANSLGISANVFHYCLMATLSVVIVSAFEAVGAILVIAMLIFPGATAGLLTDRLPRILLLVTGFSVIYAVGGYHASRWLNCQPAAAMVVMAGVVFALVWVFAPRRGLLQQWLRQPPIEDMSAPTPPPSPQPE